MISTANRRQFVVAIALMLSTMIVCTLPAQQARLTLKVNWLDGAKASGYVTITGNGLLCGGVTCVIHDSNDGIYMLTAPLATNGAYTVTWTSNYYENASFSFPFSLCIAATSVCIDPATINEGALDLVFARPSDTGGFRIRSATLPSFKLVFP